MHLSATAPRTRVLHVTQPVDGGVARVVTDLARAQLAAGLHVTVACPDSPLAAGLASLGADVRRWQATRSPGPSLGREVRRLSRLIEDVRPHLLHAHSAKAGLAGRLAVRGRIPTVFQPHAWSFEAVGGITAALALKWERWGARWASRVVCVSDAERATGVRAGVAARWSVVPNGIDPRRWRPAAVGTVRAGLLPGVDPAAPLVVCVGRLCRQKGQDVLLDAWHAVRKRVPDARLALVGDGPDRASLASRAPACVLFAGAVADTVPWYQAADLVVLPSRWEGMALAPLEAMACGRPVVMTDVDGARESLPPELVSGCLVPPEDPAALAGAVAGLLLDPPLRESLGERGRRHVLSTHDVRHAAEAVTDVYRDLLGVAPAAVRTQPAAERTKPAAELMKPAAERARSSAERTGSSAERAGSGAGAARPSPRQAGPTAATTGPGPDRATSRAQQAEPTAERAGHRAETAGPSTRQATPGTRQATPTAERAGHRAETAGPSTRQATPGTRQATPTAEGAGHRAQSVEPGDKAARPGSEQAAPTPVQAGAAAGQVGAGAMQAGAAADQMGAAAEQAGAAAEGVGPGAGRDGPHANRTTHSVEPTECRESIHS